MAKKDLRDKIEKKYNAKTITQSYLSEETLNKAKQKEEKTKEEETKAEEQKPKRSYTKFANKENKTHTISLRLTDKEFKEFIEKVKHSECGTITEYIMQQIKRGK